MSKKEVLSHRDILVLARERLVANLESCKRMLAVYEDCANISPGHPWIISIQETQKELNEFERQFDYISGLIISLDDRNFALRGGQL